MQETGGTYRVPPGEGQLEQLVLAHAVPPPAAPGSAGVSLVKMGFPSKNPEAPGTAAFLGVWGRGEGRGLSGAEGRMRWDEGNEGAVLCWGD